jgi:hypothetical protein
LEEHFIHDENLCEAFVSGIFSGMLRPYESNDGTNFEFFPFVVDTMATYHVFDYRVFYDSDPQVVGVRGGNGRRNACLVRALFHDTGYVLTLVAMVDRSVVITRADQSAWDTAKNRLYSKVLWVSQVYMHLGNHLRLAPIAVSVWQLSSVDHWLFQLLHPFMGDLPFINECRGLTSSWMNVQRNLPRMIAAPPNRYYDKRVEQEQTTILTC